MDLDAVEVFDMLSRCLNLSINIMRQHLKFEGEYNCYFDCKCMDSGNHIEGTT